MSIKIRIRKSILSPGLTIIAIYLKLRTDCFVMHMTGLYVLLDWAKDDYVFVDTGVGCVSDLCGYCVSFKLLVLHVWCGAHIYLVRTQLMPYSATQLPFLGIYTNMVASTARISLSSCFTIRYFHLLTSFFTAYLLQLVLHPPRRPNCNPQRRSRRCLPALLPARGTQNIRSSPLHRFSSHSRTDSTSSRRGRPTREQWRGHTGLAEELVE